MGFNFFRFFIIVFILFFISCGNYSFKGSLPSYIKKVAIPLFDNNTAYPEIQEDLTNKVVDEFVSDNTLEVTNEYTADIIISGTIESISQRVASLTKGETVTGYNLYINVNVKCEEVSKKKNLWEKTISQYGVMTGEGSQDERDAAIAEAIEKIAEDIKNNTLAYW